MLRTAAGLRLRVVRAEAGKGIANSYRGNNNSWCTTTFSFLHFQVLEVDNCFFVEGQSFFDFLRFHVFSLFSKCDFFVRGLEQLTSHSSFSHF